MVIGEGGGRFGGSGSLGSGLVDSGPLEVLVLLSLADVEGVRLIELNSPGLGRVLTGVVIGSGDAEIVPDSSGLEILTSIFLGLLAKGSNGDEEWDGVMGYAGSLRSEESPSSSPGGRTGMDCWEGEAGGGSIETDIGCPACSVSSRLRKPRAARLMSAAW